LDDSPLKFCPNILRQLAHVKVFFLTKIAS